MDGVNLLRPTPPTSVEAVAPQVIQGEDGGEVNLLRDVDPGTLPPKPPMVTTPPPAQPADAGGRNLLEGYDKPLRPEGRDILPDERPIPGMVEAFLMNAMQGASWGASDEWTAALKTGFGWWGDFQGELAAQQRRLRQAREVYPMTSIAGEVAGMVPSVLLTGGGGVAGHGARLATRLAPVAGQTAAKLTGKTAALAAARETGEQMGRVGLAGALQGAVSGFLGAEGTLDERFDVAADLAMQAGGIGLAFPGLARLGRMGKDLISQAAYRRKLARDPEFRRMVEAEAAAQAEAKRYGIDLSRGQASQDLTQQQVEQELIHGARGEGGARAMRRFGEAQEEQVREAQEGIAYLLGGKRATPQDVGEMVPATLYGIERRLAEEADTRYGNARLMTAYLDGGHVASARTRILGNLEDQDITIDPSLTPAAVVAMQKLDSMSASVLGAPGAPGVAARMPQTAISWEKIDRVRRSIGGLSPVSAADRRAVGSIMRSFDEWLEDGFDRQLLSGDPRALQEIQAGRRAARARFLLTAPKPRDVAGRKIAMMIEGGHSPQAVADWIYGASVLYGSDVAYQTARRLKGVLGEKSEAWEAVRQGGWVRMVGLGDGLQGIARNIEEFVGGKGKPIASVLWTEAERETMLGLARTIRRLKYDTRAVNPPSSGHTTVRGLARVVGRRIDAIAGSLGFAGAAQWALGDAMATGVAAGSGAVAALAARKAATDTMGLGAARKATTRRDQPLVSDPAERDRLINELFGQGLRTATQLEGTRFRTGRAF